MPVGFKVIVVCFGALYFLAHLAFAIYSHRYSVRYYASRDAKLETVGKVIPGLAGILLAASALFVPSAWSVVCAVLTFLLMFVGRAVYESIVFGRTGRPERK